MTDSSSLLRRFAARPRFDNLSMWIGLALVLVAIFFAARGPALAPYDPLKIHYIVRHPETGLWVKPPFDPGEMPGFPLGTDAQGRDVLSQLLHALRPTLSLVFGVAAVRLILGIVLGLLAAWGGRTLSRALDLLISIALSAPVLFVALFIISAFGMRYGVWAFILGLSLTGWAETARIIREQTRALKTQPFIEAALSLGATRTEVLVRHVLLQIMPLVWILLPFEVSATLMTTAGLGFLGYFIHTTWMPLGDWTALRIAGRPELGQMLASGAHLGYEHPWSILAAGTAVLVIVLGFNLLGAGLQTRQDARNLHRRKSRLEQAAEEALVRLEDRWLEPFSPLRRNVQFGLAGLTLLAIIATGGRAVWEAQSFARSRTSITVPGGHYWSSTDRDPQGTLWADLEGPASPEVLWSFQDESGIPTGPVVDKDENVYLVSNAGILSSLTKDGELRWQVQLPEAAASVPTGQAVTTLALAPDGTVVVLGANASLYAFASSGAPLWNSQPEPGVLPLTPPVIDSSGVIYFANEYHMLAVNPGGQTRWIVEPPSYSYISPAVHLSADGQYLLFEDTVSKTADGSLVFSSTFDPMDRIMVGTDGQFYRNGPKAVYRIDLSTGKGEEQEYLPVDGETLGINFTVPSNAGISPNGMVWIWYAARYQAARFVWLDQSGAVRLDINYPWEGVHLISLDRNGVSYACGVGAVRGAYLSAEEWIMTDQIQCWAHQPGRPSPVWTLEIDDLALPTGGALAPDRLYLTTFSGTLYAIGE